MIRERESTLKKQVFFAISVNRTRDAILRGDKITGDFGSRRSIDFGAVDTRGPSR